MSKVQKKPSIKKKYRDKISNKKNLLDIQTYDDDHLLTFFYNYYLVLWDES